MPTVPLVATVPDWHDTGGVTMKPRSCPAPVPETLNDSEVTGWVNQTSTALAGVPSAPPTELPLIRTDDGATAVTVALPGAVLRTAVTGVAAPAGPDPDTVRREGTSIPPTVN